MWDRLKCYIKSFTINYSRERWRHLSREKIFAINQLSFLKRRLAAGRAEVKSAIRELETFLKQLFDQQLEGSKIRSRVKWLGEGETPSKFFLRLENERYAKSFVSSVFNSLDTEVFSISEMMTAHEDFYSDLFSREDLDLAAQQELFSYVKARLTVEFCCHFWDKLGEPLVSVFNQALD